MIRFKSTAPVLDRFFDRYGKPPVNTVEAAGERVWRNVCALEPKDHTSLRPLPDAPAVQFRNSRLPILAMAGAALILTMSLALVRNVVREKGGDAIARTATGERFKAGEIIRSDDRSTVFNLADGTRVEMQLHAELFLERAEDGVRIRLNHGTILVTAAKQRDAHLYVQTKDVAVSVVGTVFQVTAEELGSRVAVIEGAVLVRQGAATRTLLAGEEISTTSGIEKVEVKPAEQPPEKHATPSQVPQPAQRGATPQRAQFDVASIKRNNTNQPTLFNGGGPGRYVATNTPVRLLILSAYKIEDFQLAGAPDWVDSERYDIDARTDTANAPNEIKGSMLQALLEDRFQLKLHGETKDAPVYFLTVAKSGLKLTAGPCVTRDSNAPIVRGPSQTTFCGFFGVGDNFMRATSTTAQALSEELSSILRRKVLDRTGFAGRFDVNLKWAPDGVAPGNPALASPDLPSIFTALEEQLGLKLESGKAPIDVLVIDRIERPSEN
jgi:uncharacterized protein (TIGR03435 family)